jgi:hypothetical protein
MLSKNYPALYAHINNGGEALGLINYKTSSGTFRDACKINKRSAMIEFGVRGFCYFHIDFEYEREIDTIETEEDLFLRRCEEYNVEFCNIDATIDSVVPKQVVEPYSLNVVGR